MYAFSVQGSRKFELTCDQELKPPPPESCSECEETGMQPQLVGFAATARYRDYMAMD
jgi:hypothetical protein